MLFSKKSFNGNRSEKFSAMTFVYTVFSTKESTCVCWEHEQIETSEIEIGSDKLSTSASLQPRLLLLILRHSPSSRRPSHWKESGLPLDNHYLSAFWNFQWGQVARVSMDKPSRPGESQSRSHDQRGVDRESRVLKTSGLVFIEDERQRLARQQGHVWRPNAL